VRLSHKELKAEYAKQQEALREFWNAFDPIGVMDDPDWPRDEYDRYLPQTLRLLKDRAGTLALARYVENMARDEMDMPVSHQAAIDCARKLEAWFENGSNTSVD
jgi:hypothetical protein